MVLEIINPSDSYTMETDDKAAACAAVSLLGSGQYGLKDLANGEDILPVLIFCQDEDHFNEIFKKYAGMGLNEVMETRREQVAEALESVLIGDRAAYEDAIKGITDDTERAAFAEKWHAEKRTSLNDIGGRAKDIAAALRRSSETP
ncbi:MAG: hypothetical protein KOO63_05410 [Bacteroidales bacterium]|nr:hypothetical protein [Candidatus Latescibacterota bacterium]